MNKQFGEERAKALVQYQGATALTKQTAREIVTTLWPNAEEASPIEVFKAITLCVQYRLNPLMGHLFLIPYWNSRKKKYDYVCTLSIKTNRLIPSRKHSWSYLDDTPRIMSEEEEVKHYRKVNEDKIRAIVKLKDLKTGAEATGFGEWNIWKLDGDGKKVRNEPKGIDKGNSMENMACIRAERNGLDKLYPADLPSRDIPVVDENYIEGDYKVIDEETGEITEPELEEPPDETCATEEELRQMERDATAKAEPQAKEHWCYEHNCPFQKRKGPGGTTFYSHKEPSSPTGWCNEGKKKDTAPPPAPEPEPVAEAEPEQEAPAETKILRDPDTIRTLNDLFKACNEDFKLQPDQVIKELGFSSQTDISDTPAECFRKVAAVRL